MVFGPKRLLGQVIEEVQRLGVLHIDHIESEEAPVTPLQLSEEERNRVQMLERTLARIEGVLTLLPPAAAGASPPDLSALTVEEIDARAAEIERRVRELTRTRLELEEERSLIESYEGAVRALSPLLNAFAGSKTLEAIGFLLNTKDLTAVTPIRNELVRATDGRVEVASRIVDENRIGVVIAFRKQDADLVRPVLSRMGISELHLPGRFAQAQPADTLALMERRKREIPAEIQRIDGDLAEIARADRHWLAAARAVLADQLARMKVLPELAQSHYTFILHGWAPTRAVREIRARLRERFGGETVVYDQPVDPHEDPGRVPVMLDNPPLIRPFQRLLALFQPPRYGAWDPSPVMAITFPFFVGLVIGDIGYGLLMFWAGWALRQRARAGKPLVINFLNLRFQPELLADASFVLRVSAFWIIVFGFVYLEVFGNLVELLAHRYHWSISPLFNRMADQNRDLYFYMIVGAGILMIFFGLLVHFVQALRHRHWVGVFEAAVIMLGTGGLLLFLSAEGNVLPAAFGAVGLYLFLGAVVIAFASLIVERDVIKRFLWLLESTTTFGHILSHVRLMAFGLAAAALALAANELGPTMATQFHVPGLIGTIFGWLVAALAQTGFFVFTIMGHLIQPARLHWVEFFMKFKFHEETGRRYQPFHSSEGVDVS